MRTPGCVGLAVAVLALLTPVGLAADPQGDRKQPAAPVVFVCRNGVAMSVWSARTFDRLAQQRGLSVRAVSRASAATYTKVPLRMRLALALDGFAVGDYQPKVIDAADVRGASRIILIDTALPTAAADASAAIETWAGFPPMREEYFASRAALRTRVERLVEQLAARQARGAH